jgi:hypothetical protein
MPGWSALVLMLFLALNCARFPARPTKPLERGGVRAWIVTADAIPTQGPFARAQAGDLALSDGDMVMVVSQPARGGQWIDVGRMADKGYDYLGQLAPIYDKASQLSYVIDTVRIADEAPEARPAIVAQGHDRRRPRVQITTRFEILPTSHAILLTTHLRNGTSATLSALALGDRVAWGADNVFLPQSGNIWRPNQIETSGTWLCSWQDNFCLGMTPAQGGVHTVFGNKEALLFYPEGRLEPGAELTFRRYFPVREIQISSVSAFAARLRGATLGRLEGDVREATTNNPVANCRVEILSSQRTPGTQATAPLMWTYTNDAGRFGVALPEGRYFAWTDKAVGRRGPGGGISYDVAVGKTTTLSKPLQVSPPVMLNFEVRDADTSELLPCKLTFDPFPAVPMPDFGPEWRGPGARNVYFSATGQGRLTISAGRYEVTVSRGVEYETFVIKDKEIAFSAQNRLDARLKRVIRTESLGLKDFISVDMGVRTSASPGCRVRATDRVISAAAEGVQCLISGDVGVATDLTSAIEQTHLAKWVSAICGRRIEWRGPQARGEMLAFPVPPGSVAPAQLEREANAPSPDRFMQAIRRIYPDSLLSVCRPMAPARGYLATQGFSIDHKRPIPVLPRGAMGFNLFEAVSGNDLTVSDSRQMYARLLREVGRYGLAAGSDSHYLRGNECGYPRIYVGRSSKPGATLADQIRDGLLSGRVLVTNGPFIRLLVNGQPPGSFVTTKQRRLDLLLEVQAPPWVDVRTVVVYDGEMFIRQLTLPPSTRLLRFPRGETASPEFAIPLKNDVIITAAAFGQNSLAPVVTQDDCREFAGFPIAITGPIFVDADGDGKCTPPNPFAGARQAEPF